MTGRVRSRQLAERGATARRRSVRGPAAESEPDVARGAAPVVPRPAEPLSPRSLLAIQHALGNACVSRLLASGLAGPSRATASAASRPPASASAIHRSLVQRDSTDVHAELTGHASPRWEHTRGGSRSELNLRLSQDRVDAVKLFFEEMLGNALRERGLDADIQYISRNVEVPAPVGAPSSTSLADDAVGHAVTEGEAGGDKKANDPSMRRVDVKITVTWQVEGAAMSSSSEEIKHPEYCEPNATDQWSVKLLLSGGAGHAGVGGTGALGFLKNRLTGQVAQGSFQGGGLGVGLSTPGADPGWGSYEDFTTDSKVTFEDFDGTLARLTSVGAGIALIGYSLAYLSFPMLGANSISVGGFNMGALGADAGTNVGTWNVIGKPPGPICTPAHSEFREVTVSEPYNTAMPNEFRTRVLFDTGKSEITDAELVKLQKFVDDVMANYEYSGAEESRVAE